MSRCLAHVGRECDGARGAAVGTGREGACHCGGRGGSAARGVMRIISLTHRHSTRGAAASKAANPPHLREKDKKLSEAASQMPVDARYPCCAHSWHWCNKVFDEQGVDCFEPPHTVDDLPNIPLDGVSANTTSWHCTPLHTLPTVDELWENFSTPCDG